MSGDKITVGTPEGERTDAQVARAAPVSLPPGSFDAAALQAALDDAAKAKNDGKRDELVEEAVAKANEIGTDAAGYGLQPGYKRVEADVVDLGVTESRIVYDPSKADEAAAAQAGAPVTLQPGAADAAALKGE